MNTLEKIAYKGWENCLALRNDKVELIITTDVGPRIIRFGFLNGENVFKEYEDDLGKTGGNEWRVYGGHRFWHAPEDIKRTYILDNDKIEYEWKENKLTLTKEEKKTSITKKFEIELSTDEAEVTVKHILINNGCWGIEAAPWALSVMAKSGTLYLPQEDFIPHADNLLPARSITIWHYTDLEDKRIKFDKDYIKISQDSGNNIENKIGIYNSKGWGSYVNNGIVFTKIYEVFPTSRHTDLGCNTECFINKDMLEFETLGEFKRISAYGGTNELTEKWILNKLTEPLNLSKIVAGKVNLNI